MQSFRIAEINVENAVVLDTGTVVSNSSHRFYLTHSGGSIHFRIPNSSFRDLAFNPGQNSLDTTITDDIPPFFLPDYPQAENKISDEVSLEYIINEESKLFWFLTETSFNSIEEILNATESIRVRGTVENSNVLVENTIRLDLPTLTRQLWYYGYLEDVQGNRSEELTLFFKSEVIVGVADDPDNTANKMIVYPNPASSRVAFSNQQFAGRQFQLSIIDMTGRTVFEDLIRFDGTGVFQLSVQQFNAGKYHAILFSDENLFKIPFIKR